MERNNCPRRNKWTLHALATYLLPISHRNRPATQSARHARFRATASVCSPSLYLSCRHFNSRRPYSSANPISVSAFVITFSILFTLANVSPTHSYIVATALSWQQLELSYSLVSATLPCLRWFSGSLYTFENNTAPNDSYNTWPDGSYKLSTSHSRTYSLSLRRHISGAMSAKESLVQAAINLTAVRTKDVEMDAENVQHHVGRLRPERLNSRTVISGGIRSHSRNSTRSQSGSQDLIIRRDVRFLVENHHAFKGSCEHFEGGPQ